MKQEELIILQESLKEVKDQFKIYLDGFDDIKKKNQILLLICSLFITLPLSSEFTLKLILNSNHFIVILSFLTGILFLFITIILLIYSMHDIPVDILKVEKMVNAIGKNPTNKILKAVILNYIKNLNKNIEKSEKKLPLIRLSETFIKIGIIFISLSFMYVILS